ncbi:hypothetical protein K461DRAFT_161533 [Myriangium duriaei CBS 260.36]|uniref:Uncharacterized protein n=1 Tax=Myriangium duriaei CBS 260.36 TaxID=1168546 RepID=A0A9P4IY82_9PEZI|nr:hypothetical protein K461DRAFT_161533 [Myriangium duriaei CBS 260.36]
MLGPHHGTNNNTLGFSGSRNQFAPSSQQDTAPSSPIQLVRNQHDHFHSGGYYDQRLAPAPLSPFFGVLTYLVLIICAAVCFTFDAPIAVAMFLLGLVYGLVGLFGRR